MTQTVVRYRVKPDRAEENASLVEDVYEELNAAAPEAFRYATFALDDGVTFVHVAINQNGAPPLAELGAFKRFQAKLRERCDEPPVVSSARVVGSYGFGL